MESTELIKSFCERIGIRYEPDADGTCNFNADGIDVAIFDMPEVVSVILVGDLGAPPPERLEKLYAAMLEANHLFRGTAGATISRDSETGHFALCRSLPCRALDVDSFYAEIEQFVSTLEAWTKLISNYREATASEKGEAEIDISQMLMGNVIQV